MNKKTFLILIPFIAFGVWFGISRATSNPHTWTNGLVGYWSFDGQYTTSTDGTKDVSGNENWGDFVGGVKPVGGISGQALSFDGVDDYVSASSTSLNLTGSQTYEAWIYLKSYGNDYRTIITKPGQSWFRVEESPGTPGLYLKQGAVWKVIFATETIKLNTWYYLVATYNNTVAKFYVNGVDRSGSSTIGAGGIDSIIAGTSISQIVSGYGWDGLIDEVRIYNRALSADEVKQHYDQTRRNLVIDPTQSYYTYVNTSVPSNWWTSGLVGYWNFDGPNTTSTNGTRDTSGNNNWGAFSGGVKPVGGISGQALSFDGVDDKITLPVSTSWWGNQTTIELWVNTSETTGAQQRVPIKLWASADNYLELRYPTSGGTLGYLRARINAVNYDYTLLATVSTGWQHLVLTFSGSDWRFYYNGVQTATQTGTSLTNMVGTPTVWLGTDNGVNFFNGLMDEVRIYNRALSADEVKQHYEQTRRNLGI